MSDNSFWVGAQRISGFSQIWELELLLTNDSTSATVFSLSYFGYALNCNFCYVLSFSMMC